jgi:predicted transport protein
MRLTLNMRFDEISDPRGICTDVTAVGRWGNGDVEFRIKDVSDVPYAIGLVRQAIEGQLGNGDEA